MKTNKKVIWGLILIAVGVLFALRALNIVYFNIFFDGWWTLFIIVPCAVGLVRDEDKTGSLVGIAIGVFLLLCCQNVLSFSLLWKLLVPVIIVIVGIRLIFSGVFGSKSNKAKEKLLMDGKSPRVGFSAFSSTELNLDGQIFEGAELTAVFGGVKCDLRGAEIKEDCVISVCAVFGGIDILMPPCINVKTDSVSLFGGMSNKLPYVEGALTVYVKGCCVFGGTDIK